MKELLDLKLSLLEAGGIDNWCNYSDAIGSFLENNPDIEYEDLTENSELMLLALENGGVDNFPFYSESLEGYSEYSEYFKQTDNPLNFYEFIEKRKDDAIISEHKKEKKEKELQLEGYTKDIHNMWNKINNLNEDSAEYTKLYIHIKDKYINYSKREINTIYLNMVDLLTSGEYLNGVFIKEFEHAKKQALKSSTVAIDFKNMAKSIYLNNVINNENIEEVLENKKDISVENIFKRL